MKFVREYNGYVIEFVFKEKIADYFNKKKVDMLSILNDTWLWFEVVLFELIDDDCDGVPDEIYGKNFQVVFYGIIEEYKGNRQIGFDVGYVSSEIELIEDNFVMNIEDKFFVKYALIRKVFN